MTSSTIKPMWGNAFQLGDLLEQVEGGREFAVRDFALLSVAAELTVRFPRQLVFKGGFVLRHVHGVLRFSEDVDTTRSNPAKARLNAGDVADAIRGASRGDVVRFKPGTPATDSGRSLDFDSVQVSGSLLPTTHVQVEISYREDVVDPPIMELIGPPFYAQFAIPAMAPAEMVAEKLRALAQRVKVTDLADLAELLTRDDVRDTDIARLASSKFTLVREGKANRQDRIHKNLIEMQSDYNETVKGYFPGAKEYREAYDAVWPRVRDLIP